MTVAVTDTRRSSYFWRRGSEDEGKCSAIVFFSVKEELMVEVDEVDGEGEGEGVSRSAKVVLFYWF